MRSNRWLGIGLISLGAVLAANSLLGPLWVAAIDYRVTTLLKNQTVGLDAVSLAVVAPLTLAAGVLVLRRHPAGPVLGLGSAVYVAYMFTQYILGPDYLGLPGNNELFLPLHFGLFVAGGTLALRAWQAIDLHRLPRSRRFDLLAGILMLALAGFLAVRWTPALLDATSEQPRGVDYREGPTFFWTIALLDLGIAVPVALASGLALLRSQAWARKAAYGVVSWFALVGAAVLGMNVAYHINDDPNASTAMLVGFTVVELAFVSIAIVLYRPLFKRGSVVASRSRQRGGRGTRERTGVS